MKQNSVSERLVNGIVLENPTFVLMLGMCPTLAVTTSAINGLGMGLTISVVGLMAHRIGTAHVITHQPSWFLALRILGTLMVIGIGFILLSHSSAKPF